MEGTRIRPLLTVLALMIVTSLAASRVGEPDLSTEAAVRRPLPRGLGEWTGHALLYCSDRACAEAYGADEFDGDRGAAAAECPLCGSPLDVMAPIERALLPRETEVFRSVYRGGDGGVFFVSVVIGGRDRLSLHRPENCLPGQGLSIRGSRIMETRLPDGRSLPVRLLDVRRQVGGSDAAVSSYFAYWYVAPGRETPSQLRLYAWMAADRLLHARMDRWAYVAVAHDFDPVRETGDSIERLKDFIAALHPAIVTDGSGTE